MLHDWSRAERGHLHCFCLSWLVELVGTLNEGLLPSGYYALTDQPLPQYLPDESRHSRRPQPKADERIVADPKLSYLQRRIVIRRAKANTLVAVVAMVTPENKGRREAVGAFAGQVVDLLNSGVHVLVVDILPPTRYATRGMHWAIWSLVEHRWAKSTVLNDRPLLVASYRAERKPIAYLNHSAVGLPLPAGPLYFDDSRFIDVPLDATYQKTYDRLPAPLKAEIEH